MRLNQRIYPLLKLLLLLVILLVMLRLLLPTINSPAFQQFTQELGILGYLIVIGYTVFSHVFAPIAGSPGVALGVAVYGIHTGSWLLYIATLISATINYWISRQYGRGVVVKLVGHESMQKIDEFGAVQGRSVLILARVFGFSLVDFISYAAGLTSIRFRDYFVITAVFGLLPNLAMQYVFRDTDFGSERGVLLWGASILATALVFGFGLTLYLRRRRMTEPRVL